MEYAMAARLRIAFFGSSLLSAYWNSAATYYRGLIRALHEHGHRVTFYEPEAFERQKHCDMPASAYAYSVIYPAHDAGVESLGALHIRRHQFVPGEMAVRIDHVCPSGSP